MEDFASAISDLLKKCMGDNGWRFWLCAFIVLSIMWYVERNNYCGYGALFSLLMTTLLLIGYIREIVPFCIFQYRTLLIISIVKAS